MDFGSAMKFHNDSADKTYLNSGYTDKRTKRQTLIIDEVIGNAAVDKVTFTLDLQEPLIIDSLSDIYLDSFTTFKTKYKLTNYAAPNPPQHTFQPSSFLYLLRIDQFDVKTSSNDPLLRDKIIIPNESTDNAKTFSHRARKLNYICSINPQKLYKLNGTITNLAGATAFEAATSRFIAEFVIIARD